MATKIKITNELYLTAASSSLIIAFFGVIQFYVFDRPETLYSIKMFLGLSTMFFIAWLILFFLVQRHPQWSSLRLFCVSFLCNISARAACSALGLFDFFPPDFLLAEFIYFVSTLLPINGILVIILKFTMSFMEKTETERQLQALKLETAETHTKILIQQLHPHFLFNSLSVLKSLISESPQKAENYVITLSEFLRYSIEASSNDLTDLERELDFVESYILLQKERFEDSFSYFIQIEDRFLRTKIPIMALQIVIENVFKHNGFTKQNPLSFSITIENNFLVVENTKNALRQIDSPKTGLKNIGTRYELLAQKTIIIQNNPHNFVVKLPLL